MNFTEFLIDWTVRAVVLLGIVSLIAWGCREWSAARRHLIWAVALLTVLLLPLVALVLPTWGLFPDEETTSITGASSALILETPPLAEVAQGGTAQSVVPPSRIPWKDLLGLLWAAGVVVQFSRWFLGNRVLRRLLSGAEESDDTVSVYDGPPLVVGLVRPRIFLPRGFQSWENERRDAVIGHERAHLKRRDLWWEALSRIVCVVQWWNPLVYVASKQMREASEQACDDQVLCQGMPAAHYASHLLEIARQAHARHAISTLAVTMARGLPIEDRVQRVLDDRKSRQPLTRTPTLAIVGVLSVVAVGMATVGAADEKAKQAEMKKRLKSLVVPRFQLDAVDLEEAVKQLAKASREADDQNRHLVIEIDEAGIRSQQPGLLDQQSITLNLQNVPVSELLRYVTTLAGVTFEVGTERVTILAETPDQIIETKRAVSKDSGYASGAAFKRLLEKEGVRFEEGSSTELVQPDGLPHDFLVHVNTRAMQERSKAILDRVLTRPFYIQKWKLTDYKVGPITVREAIRDLQDRSAKADPQKFGRKFIIDEAGMNAASKAVLGKSIQLDLGDVTVAEALDEICEQAGLGYQPQRFAIKIVGKR